MSTGNFNNKRYLYSIFKDDKRIVKVVIATSPMKAVQAIEEEHGTINWENPDNYISVLDNGQYYDYTKDFGKEILTPKGESTKE